MSGNNNKNIVIIPIHGIHDKKKYIPEKERNHIWSFLCILSTMISSIFCCITA